jgi:DNA-binding NarL/FixJ family response regulator
VAQGRVVRFGGVAFLLAAHEGKARDVDSSVDTGGMPRPDGPEPLGPEADLLSEAQQRVFTLLAVGLTEKRVAARLGISPNTVHNHVRAIYRSFNVHSRPELLAHLVKRRRRQEQKGHVSDCY